MPEAFEFLLCRPPASQLRLGDQHQPAYPAGCCAIQIDAEATGTGLDTEIDDVMIAAILKLTLQRPHRSRNLRHGWHHRRRLHQQRGVARNL